jgi:endonuclease G
MIRLHSYGTMQELAKKSEVERLRSILAQFDTETVRAATREALETSPRAIKRSYKDFPGNLVGKESHPGEQLHLTMKELIDTSTIERIVGRADFLPVHFLQEGAIVQRAVARVNLGGSFGTGFMVSPTLFMTNNHVLSTTMDAANAIFEFNFQLDYNGNTLPIEQYRADPNSVFHTNTALDYTLVRLQQRCIPRLALPLVAGGESGAEMLPAGTEYYGGVTPNLVADHDLGRPAEPVLNLPPPVARICFSAGKRWGYLPLRDRNMAVNQRLNVIQHPDARPKEVALHDNEITTIFANALRYRTDTEPGSSGSPVFDNEWELIALHHAGGDFQNGQWLNNEGMRIDRIIDDLQNHYRGTPAGQAILDELGIP